MRRFVIGDIHGRYDALKEVLTKSKFDYENDLLIILGDVVDGGYNTSEVIDELLKIKNKVFVIGNHDQMYMDYLFKGESPSLWINQGGANTLNSYGGRVVPGASIEQEPVMLDVNGVRVPKTHVEFFSKGLYYFEYDGMVFVHGGFEPDKPLNEQEYNDILWDRSIIRKADIDNIPGYDKVFIGHTPTQSVEREFVNYHCRNCNNEWSKKVVNRADMQGEPVCKECESTNIYQSLGCTQPLKIGNLYCLDTGAGWDGRLTIFDIDTEEFHQSSLQRPPIE